MKTASLARLCTLSILSAALAPLASSQNTPPAQKPPAEPLDPPQARPEPAPATEAQFVVFAAKSSSAEAQLAELAAAKSQSAKIKELAAVLAKDNNSMHNEVLKLADKVGVKLTDLNDPKFIARFEELIKKGGPEFDTAFLHEMTKLHERDLIAFEASRKVVTSIEAVNFINNSVPVFRNHLAKIKQLRAADSAGASPVDPVTPRPAGQ